MARFLAGLGFACITGGLTALVTRTEPWWLIVAGVTAVVVWFGRRAVEAVADALDDLT
jgi:hypothetical protein